MGGGLRDPCGWPIFPEKPLYDQFCPNAFRYSEKTRAAFFWRLFLGQVCEGVKWVKQEIPCTPARESKGGWGLVWALPWYCHWEGVLQGAGFPRQGGWEPLPVHEKGLKHLFPHPERECET